MNDIEYWKDLEDSEYQISNLGRIRKTKILHPATNTGGYKYIIIKNKRFLIHRLVAEAFLPNPDKKTQVNHIDSDRSNNELYNLEWVTPQENILHSYRCSIRKLEYVIYRKEDNKEFPSISSISKYYNTDYRKVKDVLEIKNGKKFFSEKKLLEILSKKDNRHKTPKNAIKIKYVPTGKVYSSITAAAKDLGFCSIYEMNKAISKQLEKCR